MLVGEEVVFGHAGDELGRGSLGKMTAELREKIHRQPRRAPVVAHARLERGAAVFEGLCAYISSGARSRPKQ